MGAVPGFGVGRRGYRVLSSLGQAKAAQHGGISGPHRPALALRVVTARRRRDLPSLLGDQ